jgi:hypothetical protein
LESGEEQGLSKVQCRIWQGSLIGAPDSKLPALIYLYTYLPDSKIGIGERSFQMRTGFIMQNLNFEKSQELKGYQKN